MMIKKLLLLIILSCPFKWANAQKKQNIYFYKGEYKEVFSKDSADFIRIIQEPDSGNVYFNLIELYPDGQKKTLGTVSRYSPYLIREGEFASYYKNGKRKSLVHYENDKIVGASHYFFENGSLREILELKDAPLSKNIKRDQINNYHPTDTVINYLADSLGHVMIEKGNGHVIEQISSFGGAVLEKNYKDGLPHGTWTMKNHVGTCWYKEEFDNGKFISGESEKDGIKFRYTQIDESPTLKGGIEKFYNYAMRNNTYPSDAQRGHIQGKVFLSFIVETDGNLTNVNVERRLYPSLDSEAVRIIKCSPKWISGKSHGFPIRAKLNMPLSFTLNVLPGMSVN
ncbi:TonB family protein [Pedobacter sp. PAMC26386]|nr:TonB family protein [Pedobacter sp. PAMC26386]